jgi:hypothetical protein
MYQVNYNGLKKRESYDEIVAIIENDQTKVKYPNRVALQIMNSPYMKQLDYETVMDVQNQQDRLAKQKMKDMVLQEIARQTGTPYVQLRAQHDPSRMAPAVSQARSVSDYQEALEDRVSDYRAEVGEMLNAQTQTETSRKFEMADLVAQQLSGESYHPVADGMTAEREIQAMVDTDDKETQTGVLREQEELRRLADENRQMELAMKEKGTQQQKMQEIYNRLEEKLRHAEMVSLQRPEHKAAITSIASSIQAVAGGGKMSPQEAQEMLRRLRLLYEKSGGYGGSSSSSGMLGLGSLASLFNIFTPQATPRYPSSRKRPAPEPEEPQMQRAKSEPRSGASAKSFSVGSAVAIPVKNEMVKAQSVKSEDKSRTATHSGNISQRYPLFAEGVKKQSGSAKSASVKSKKSSASGSAAQRAGMMALPVGNEPFEGPSPGGSTTSSARLHMAGIKTPTELKSSSKSSRTSRTSSLNDFQIGPVMAVPMSGSRQPSVVSVQSSRKSAK